MTRRATFRGGIYVTDLETEGDRVVVGIFASRPIALDDLRARLTLRDSTGTRYEHATHEPLVVEGRARLLFTPGLPAEVTWLQLSEPGSGSTWLLDPGQAEAGGPG